MPGRDQPAAGAATGGSSLWTTRLDRAAPLPLGRQLAAALREAVAEGRLGSDARLPSTRTLARELGVARSTVVAVFEQLAAEGYIASRPGSGYFIPAPLHQRQPVGVPAAPPAPRPLSRRAEGLRSYAPHWPG